MTMTTKKKLAIGIVCFVAITALCFWVHWERNRAAVTSCHVNILQIDGAKQSWALEKNMTANDIPTWADLLGFMRGMPVCPYGGRYTIGKVGELPTCTIPDPQNSMN